VRFLDKSIDIIAFVGYNKYTMAKRNIVKINDSQHTLNTVCKAVTQFDDRLAVLIDDMIETMIDANGCGLAAPQVGILKRVFVICVDGETVYEFVNPEIIKTIGKQHEYEGCLSIPNFRGVVPRPKKLVVRAFDRHGKQFELKVEDLFAIAVCHENDHLDGILFDTKVILVD